MRVLLAIFLALVICGLGWFQFGQPLSAKALLARAEDDFDRRPARTILILGNSRTFYHDMPDMVPAMADSAHDPQKLEITVDAPAGASFEILWNDDATQRLLKQRWDDVILQGESCAQSSDELAHSFQTYGAKLIDAAHPAGGHARLVVNWAYASRLWDDGDPDGSGRADLKREIRSSTGALGERTGAHLVDVPTIWSAVERDHPEIALTEDGNHPSLAGSYLFALTLYGDLSGRDVGAVTYVPSGLDPSVAVKIRQDVRDVQAMS
ncbi:MAG TPA: hypothetical protein VN137_11120 [Sphingomonas sp.]|nr:hypothetical protein [Sphingomonas sp.]